MDRDLTASEFQQFHDLIYRIAGIHYPKEKLELLSNRIRRRIRAVGANDYGSYLKRISAPSSPELQSFLDTITTNETYFFRCQRHWDHFEKWLQEQKQDPEARRRGLRIWSAAASNGAEACTMLIVLHKVFGDRFGGMPVEVLGTDLSTEILAEAKQGVFRPYALAQTAEPIVKRYFTPGPGKDDFVFDRTLLRHARFEQHNLMQRLNTAAPFDAVFVRNVMIYFDQKSREQVLDNVYKVLRPGGLLIVGESESLLSVRHQFEYVKPSIFWKPTSPQPSKA